MHRGKLFGTVVEQVVRQHGSQDQNVGDLGDPDGRQGAEIEIDQLFAEKRRGDQHADDVVPSGDGHRAEFHQFRFDEDRVGRGGEYADQDQQVADLFALLLRPAVAENQYGASGNAQDDPDDFRPVDLFAHQQGRYAERYDRSHRGQRGGVDRVGILGAPQHQEFVPVNHQYRRDQNPDEVAERNPEPFEKNGPRNEPDRRDDYPQEKKGFERHVAPDDGDKEREVHPQQNVGENQRHVCDYMFFVRMRLVGHNVRVGTARGPFEKSGPGKENVHCGKHSRIRSRFS